MTIFKMSAKFSAVMIMLMASRSLAQAGVGSITQDIQTMQDYSLQPNCVQSCFEADFEVCPMDMLGIALGCATIGCGVKTWQAKNDCYCRSDLQSPAQDYLNGCISSSCLVGDPSVAAASAGSIYRQYCEGKGYDIATPASVEATTTTGTRTATKKTSSTAAPTGTTEESSTSSSNHTGIPTATLVGIIIGVVLGLILLAFAVYLLRRCHKTRKSKLTKGNLAQINGGGQAQPLRPDDSISNFNPTAHQGYPSLPPDETLVSGGGTASIFYPPPHFPQPYQPRRY